VGEVFDAGDTHSHHRVLKKRIFRCNDQIATPCQHQAARDARALDHRHGRLGDISPATAHAEILFLLARVEQFRTGASDVGRNHQAIVELLEDIASGCPDVVPGGEMLARPCQDNAAHSVVVGGALERVVERVSHLPVLRVVETGPVHRNPGDLVDHFVEDRRVGFVDRLKSLGFDQIAHAAFSISDGAA
jgi:hypothetical protein